jgi:hypothetical protein
VYSKVLAAKERRKIYTHRVPSIYTPSLPYFVSGDDRTEIRSEDMTKTYHSRVRTFPDPSVDLINLCLKLHLRQPSRCQDWFRMNCKELRVTRR